MEYTPEYMEDNGIQLSQQSVFKAPEFVAVKNKEWVPYLDTDKSQYPDKLIYYKNNSSLHGAILRNMADQVAGAGFNIEDSSSLTASATELFLNNINDEEDANEVLAKVADDLTTFKGIALLVDWAKDGSKIISVKHIDFSKVRSGKCNDKGKVVEYFYSYDWNNQRPKYVVIPAFDVNTMKEKKKAYDAAVEKSTVYGEVVPELNNLLTSPTEQLYYFHPYASNEFYYPLPYYVAATNPINTDIATDQYGLSMMDNGLSSNHVINFKGNYTPEQKKEEARNFDKSYISGVKKGRPIIVFSKDETSSVEVTPVASNGKDERYTSINENVTQKILSGHGVTSPMLVGIKEPGSLGGSAELQVAADLFYRNTIRPKQNAILKVFNNIMTINGLSMLTIERLDLTEQNTEITE